MKSFDVIEDIRTRLGTRAILAPVDALALEQAEEAFGSRIVRAGSHCAHAAADLVPFQEALVLVTRKLTGFKWSSQRVRVGVNVGDYPGFRQVSSNQESCEVGC